MLPGAARRSALVTYMRHIHALHPVSTVPRPRHASTLTLTLTRCGHCKAMKPAWGEFGKLHAKSAELLVGEVDCTAGGGEELCERFEVEGFPTLKFFEAGSSEPEEFDGDEMSVEGFETYSKALLGPACSPAALEACSTEDRKVVESYRALSPEARAAEQERLAAPLAAAKKEVKDARDEREFVEKEMEMVSRASLNPNPNPNPNPDPDPKTRPQPQPRPRAGEGSGEGDGGARGQGGGGGREAGGAQEELQAHPQAHGARRCRRRRQGGALKRAVSRGPWAVRPLSGATRCCLQ